MEWMRRRWEARRARRDERRALLLLGEALPPSAEVLAFDERHRTFERALSASLERDRDDFAAVAQWVRPLVVLRGILDRAVLRALLRRTAADRREAWVRAGGAALGTARGVLAEGARQAQEIARAAEERQGRLPLVAREALHFARFLFLEARGAVVPRLPALIGLWVGFWIAQTFTDSELSATLHSWGLGSGPRHAVRGQTLRAMSFALPLLAAALSSYAGSRLAALVRARYAPAAPERESLTPEGRAGP